MRAAEVDPHVAHRFLLQRRLGKGAYGIVWRAVDRRTGEVVAIKKIFDAFRDKIDAQRTFREILLLQEFGGHPNIIRLLDVIRAENDKDIYLVFEAMDTDLNAVIRKGTVLKDIHKRYIFYQLLQATKFIHAGHVIHRDQKPANVLLDTNCSVKLCDFGLARSLSSLAEGPEGQALTEYVATRWYRAPEVLLSSRWYTPGVDMWSLGCVLGELLRGRPLFPGTSTLHQLELILEVIPPPAKEDLRTLGSGYSASVLQRLGSRFHCPDHEWTREARAPLRVPDGAQLSGAEYRSMVYQMILERSSNSRAPPAEEGLGDALLGTEPKVARSQERLLKPRAASSSPGTPVQNPKFRSCSSPSQDLGPDAPAARDMPGENWAPLQPPPHAGRGKRPSATTVEFPWGPSWVKANLRGAVASLTSQAAAQVTNQALVRSDPPRGDGVPPPPLPREVSALPRPGRRMFGPSALQGAQGAARAALGGYSQAYGTVCHSALGHLPLFPGPRA
ncbi:mitogen-activated protein kinase 15 isoform X2 [Tupaia chinensis]|uniref:mitogen-activated protein kinase 15 isoform X2 n=1 Tax=Tupaia chinensis TaxID=246437 RepID=UPI0003C8F4F9|nr:mitogen-activated protein kinase 15 isoform X2 [Tupaia chinensis]